MENSNLTEKQIEYTTAINHILSKNGFPHQLKFNDKIVSNGIIDSFMMINIIAETSFFLKKQANWSFDFKQIDSLADLWTAFRDF